MTATTGVKTPWHIWVVGLVGVLWNGFGAFDYTMSNTLGDKWLESAGMTAEQIAHFNAMPAWMTGVWAIGVWGGVLGSILILFRRRLATPVFIASLVAFTASVVYGVFVDPAPHGGGPNMMVMHAVIFAGCAFFVWYSMRMTKRGVLV